MKKNFTPRLKWLCAGSLLAQASCSVSPLVEPHANRRHSTPVSEVQQSGKGQEQNRVQTRGSVTSALSNPFVGTVMFVNPEYSAHVEKSAKAVGLTPKEAGSIAHTSTALWVDTIAMVEKLPAYLQQARDTATQRGAKVSVPLVVYDLPERDCNANASNGELTLADDGVNKYHGYIDQIAAVTAAYTDLNIVAIVEPDSLPNIVTNLGNPKCARAREAYETGVAYAIRKLAASHVTIYLDSAHGGWLGWPDNRQRMAREVKTILDAAGGVDLIRGFSTNVSNYSPLRVDMGSVGNWYDRSNPAKDELTYVGLMAQAYADAGVTHHHFVIDTGRNGVVNSRQVWGNWCNIRGAGLGERPQVNPQPDVDAYLWIKPPGDSDGTSDTRAPRYDYNCGSQDTLLNAPEAGTWFEAHFAALVQGANPKL